MITSRTAWRIRIIVAAITAFLAVTLYYNPNAEVVALSAITIVITYGIAAAWFWSVPGPFVVLSRIDGKLLHYCRSGERMPAVNDELAPHKRIELGTYLLNTSRRFQPITPNPKVRNVGYEVSLAFGETPESAQSFYSRYGWVTSEQFGDGMPAQAKLDVQYQLYEFDEFHSIEVSRLWNPLEPTQQQEFESLVRNFLEPVMAPLGLRVDSAKFSFN
jgi:hypothetical protein